MQVVYVAFGELCIREAAISAWSVKRHMPNTRVNLTTDRLIHCDFFDRVTVVNPSHYSRDLSRAAKINKVCAILECDSEYVLYLDADTYVLSDVSDVPLAMEYHDIAAAMDNWRFQEIYELLHPGMELPKYPAWHPYFNAGVLLVKRSRLTDAFLKEWSDRFSEDERLVRDQVVLRKLLSTSKVRVRILPPEFNLRPEPVQISGKIHIIHSHENIEHWKWSLIFLADFLNSETKNRVYTPHDGKMVILNEDYTFHEKFLNGHRLAIEKEEYLTPLIQWVNHGSESRRMETCPGVR